MKKQIEALIAELLTPKILVTGYEYRSDDRAYIADRLTAILAADAGGWRPIAEAPMDGTPIIGWNGRVMLVAWGGQRPPKWREGSAFGPAAWIKPTHWRPLPEPPPQEPPR